jgi:hypothetical protein
MVNPVKPNHVRWTIIQCRIGDYQNNIETHYHPSIKYGNGCEQELSSFVLNEWAQLAIHV